MRLAALFANAVASAVGFAVLCKCVICRVAGKSRRNESGQCDAAEKLLQNCESGYRTAVRSRKCLQLGGAVAKTETGCMQGCAVYERACICSLRCSALASLVVMREWLLSCVTVILSVSCAVRAVRVGACDLNALETSVRRWIGCICVMGCGS